MSTHMNDTDAVEKPASTREKMTKRVVRKEDGRMLIYYTFQAAALESAAPPAGQDSVGGLEKRNQ